MPTVQTFSRTMIETCLKSTNLRYLTDRDGDSVLQFGHADHWGCDLDLYITAAGQNGDVLSMFAMPGHRVPLERMGDALMACNEWNVDRRYPKAALRTGNAEDGSGRFFLQLAFDLEKGIHQELLNDTVAVFIMAVDQFCRWLHDEKDFGRN
jgi:hypothetical protein